mgnify:CR=1 FL=1|jgi:hypothetical protein
MGRLEDVAMAKMRSRMQESGAEGLLQIMSEVREGCRGENERVEFRPSLIRDVYAYGAVHWFSMMGCDVFGGFVAAHLSGKEWRDIDVLMPANMQVDETIARLARYMRFLFSMAPGDISIPTVMCKRYAKKVTLEIRARELEVFQIVIDLVDPRKVPNEYVPATVGSCLTLIDGCVYKRQIFSNTFASELYLCTWGCEDIKTLLREGRDIGLCMSSSVSRRAKYRDYFWKCVKKKRECGYVIEQHIGVPPPPV